MTLKRSKKKVELVFYFGPTDQPQKQAQHWMPLLKSFEEADFIFYVGHAGMGANMSLSELQAQLALDSATIASSVSRKNYQFLGIISCYGNIYYGNDYIDLRKREGQVTDVLLTASTRYLHLLPVGILYYLDLALSGEPVSLSKTLDLFTSGRETTFVHRVKY